MRASGGIRLRDVAMAQVDRRPALREVEFGLADVVDVPELTPERQQVEGVILPELAWLARDHHTIGALRDAYRQKHPAATEPAIDRALGILAAMRVLMY
jgi:hypothetical protein